MPLQAPNLDDRDFKTLVSEARSRIPRYLPEWTDWNDSDPGITLLQLHAWLTETILYRLNRLPDLNYIKFLQLLGAERRPARPARANLTFLLNEKAGGAEIFFRKGTVVTVASPDLPQPLAFETDQALVAITARLTQVLTLGADPGPGADVTQANLVSGQSFSPFGASTQPGAALLLGFASELPFSREEIGLQIDLAEAGQVPLAPAPVARCGATPDDADAPRLAWEWWDGLDWAPLDVIADETDCLTCSGHIYFKVPGQIPAVALLRTLADGPAAIPLRLTDVAGIASEQADRLKGARITTVDDLAKLTPQRLAEILQSPVTPEMQDEARRYVETQLTRAGLNAVANLIGLTDSQRAQLKPLIEPADFLDSPDEQKSFKGLLTNALNNAPPGAGLTDEQISNLAKIVLSELKSFLDQSPRLVDPLRDALVAILGALSAKPRPGLTDEQRDVLVEKTITLNQPLFLDEQHPDWEKPLRKALTAVLTALPTPPGQDLTAEQIAALVRPILEGRQFQDYIGGDSEEAEEAKEAWSDVLTTALESLKLVDLQIEALVEQTLAQIRDMLATLTDTAVVLRQVPMGDLKWKALMERLSPARVQASKQVQAETILADARGLLAADLLYWLRVRLDRGTYASPPEIDQILTNTVQATAARTVRDEAVGAGTGRPNQQFRLRHAPVLAEPPLELEVEGETWTEVRDFYASQPGDNHYTLNRTSGMIAFGDGTRGRMPPAAGGANIVARQYRYGGGQIGNVGSGTITGLSNCPKEVEQVTNYRAAAGGADEEALADTLLRAPRELKTRDRAVTLDDFELLACETPGAQVARATAFASSGASGDTRLINVVLVPQSADPRPMPSEATLGSVCRYLDERRLITTRVVVAGPAYLDIDVLLDVRAHPRTDLKTVKKAINTRLQDYFHPLRGGPDGDGWPFGRDIYYSELLHAIMEIDGVRRIESVTLHKFLPRQPVGLAVPAGLQPQETTTRQSVGLASPPCVRQGISPHSIAGGFTSEAAALAQKDTLLGSEIAAFPGCRPVAKVIPLVVLEQATSMLPIQRYHVVAEYECADLPVAPGGLIALHEARVSVSYDRTGGSL